METPTIQKSPKTPQKVSQDFRISSKIILVLIALVLLTSFFAVVNAGQRGVLMRFGAVQPMILDEGIHTIIPIVNTVQIMSIRVQSQEISAEASSRDLQDVYADVALNWHVIPETVNLAFQRIGDEGALVSRVIKPTVEEVLKAVMAQYTAEEIITKRGEVKASVDLGLAERLKSYYIAVDDISLVHVHFSKRFSDAVEAKQVAEQEAKRAEFVAQKAAKEAEARVNLAKGDAEVQRLLQQSLTPELLKRQAIERWNGNLPIIVGGDGGKFLDLEQLIEINKNMIKQSKRNL